MATEAPILRLEQVDKTYATHPEPTPVLRGVDLAVHRGESLAVVGPSGCGKSTLLNLMGLLDAPDSGRVCFNGEDLAGLSAARAARFRNAHVGFVLQQHHLLPQCTALENVLTPTIVHPDPGNARQRAAELLDRVGLSRRMDRRPSQLSGGERQRVAVVRALINKPDLLLADEPTGSLNEEASQSLTQLLLELRQEQGMALVVVTHAMALAGAMDTVYELRDGAPRKRD